MKTARRVAARLIVISSLSAASFAYAQDKETRQLAGFDGISVGGGIDLVVRQGEGFLVEVQAPDGEADKIVTEVRAGKLEIRRERSTFSFFDWGDHGSVTVRLPTLKSLTASGGSDVTTEGTITGSRLDLVASGGSDVAIAVAVTDLNVEASGGSDIRLSGTAGSARVQSSGGSDLNASELTAAKADLNSSGGSDLSIAVSDSLVANASGGSDIFYSGNPSSTSVNSSGGSDITRR